MNASVASRLPELSTFYLQNEVDTYDIEVRIKRDEQYNSSFLKHGQKYMLRVIDPATCFGDRDLSLFTGGAGSGIGREAEVGSGLFEVGDHAPAITTPIYPRDNIG
jgi:hypothetical protein